MEMNTEKLLQRIDELLFMADDALKHQWESGMYEWYIKSEYYHSFRSAALSFVSNTLGEKHNFFKEFNAVTGKDTKRDSLNSGKGIIKALRNEVEKGWLFNLKGIVSAEIFGDFLEMAQYLLSEGYKDPAAVMIGGVLEEHLRNLCIKNGIQPFVLKGDKEVPKKADTMNNELAAAGIYGKLEQKSVVAWLDLRNKAAHGLYSEFRKEQVETMNAGVTDFIIRVS